MLPKRRTVERLINTLIAGGVLALAAPLAASPALAAQDYPPGLFENSPVVPSGPADATVPSGPPDAAFPFGPPPDAVDPLDDYCAGVPFRTFRSLAEVRRAAGLRPPRRISSTGAAEAAISASSSSPMRLP